LMSRATTSAPKLLLRFSISSAAVTVSASA
jgi:hypothetical protein